MALEQKDLQQLAELLGNVMAPKLREVISEQVSVRLEVISQALRNEFEEQRAEDKKNVLEDIAALEKSFSQQIVDANAELSNTLLAKFFEQFAVHSSSFSTATKELIEQNAKLAESCEKRFADFEKKLSAAAPQEQVQAMSSKIAESFRAINEEIAALPAPEPLVISGDLSPGMQEVSELFVKQLLGPSVEAALKPVLDLIEENQKQAAASTEEGLKAVREFIEKALQESENSSTVLHENIRSSLSDNTQAAMGAVREAVEAMRSLIRETNAATAAELSKELTSLNSVLENLQTASSEAEKAMQEDIGTALSDLRETFNSALTSAVKLSGEAAEKRASELIISANEAVLQKALSSVPELVATQLREFTSTTADALQATTLKNAKETGAALLAAATERVAELQEAVLQKTEAKVEALFKEAMPGLSEEVRELAVGTVLKTAPEAVGSYLQTLDLTAESTKTAETIATRTAHDVATKTLLQDLPVASAAWLAEALPGHFESITAEAMAGAADAATQQTNKVLAQFAEETLAATKLAAEQVAGAVAGEVAASAVARAEQAAAVAGAEAGRAGAEALRTSLVQSLDPAAKLAEGFEDLRAELPGVASSAVKEELPDAVLGVEMRMLAKVNGEIDRIRPKDGEHGKDGVDGKDARVIPPVAYEVGKTYEAGAWVAHDSGIWVSARNTKHEPHADSPDWDCVVPGVKSIEIIHPDESRTAELHFELSNGASTVKSLKFDYMINRGTFSEARAYEKHDVVTYNWSAWVAQKDGVLGTPGSCPDWKIHVRHGKDGKDMKPAEPAIIRFVGSWETEREYKVNEVVEHAGVRWLALKSTRERPPFITLVSNDIWNKLGS